MPAHVLDNVPVAHRRAHERKAEAAEKALQAQIGHDRGHYAAAGKAAAVEPGFGHQGQQLVAIDQAALLIGDQHPIGIAIKRDADVRSHLTDLLA